MKKNFYSLIVLFFFIAGILLRFYHLGSFPKYGQTQDEAAWTWLGMSLLQKGQPMSWSWSPTYKQKHIYKEFSLGSDSFRIVSPWFDNPPIFSFLPGFFAILAHQKLFDFYNLTYIRLSMVILSLFNFILLFLLTKKISKSAAIFSLAIFTTAPLFVFSSRMILSENFLIFLGLFNLLALENYLDRKNKKKNFWLMIMILNSYFAILTKLTGIAFPLLTIFILLIHRKYKESLKIFLSCFVAFTTFLLYGFKYDFQLFINTQLFNSLSRFNGYTFPEKFFSIFTITSGDNFFDGWKVFGIISLGGLINMENKILKKIFIQVIFYLIILMLASPENNQFSWYIYPVFPFLAIASGCYLREIFTRKSLAGSLLILFVILIPELVIFCGRNQILLQPINFRLIVLLLCSSILVFWSFSLKKFLPYYLGGLLLIFNCLVIISF